MEEGESKKAHLFFLEGTRLYIRQALTDMRCMFLQRKQYVGGASLYR